MALTREWEYALVAAALGCIHLEVEEESMVYTKEAVSVLF